jgi:HD superfamily phosphohydrolase YqeK
MNEVTFTASPHTPGVIHRLSLHAITIDAAEGRLPVWVVVGEHRRAHMTRVAELLGNWARSLGLDEDEQIRWRAAGYLHDVLREESPEALSQRLPIELRGLPGPLLHGPAAAEKLRVEGLQDGELLSAIAFHTVGDANFGRLGRALYAADFLEPGRSFMQEWTAELRARMPHDMNAVVFEIVQARIVHLTQQGSTLEARSIGFWNTLVGERG